MSFLTETVTRRVATLQIPRTLASSAPRAAAFSTSIHFQKTAAETAKDALKTVDRAVSDKLVDGINIGSTAAQKVKEVSEDVVGTKSTGAAAQAKGETKGKASEYAGEAKGKADELVGEAKGKANELAGKAKGTAEEAQRKL